MSDIDLTAAEDEVVEEKPAKKKKAEPSGKTYKKFEGKVMTEVSKAALKKIGKWEE